MFIIYHLLLVVYYCLWCISSFCCLFIHLFIYWLICYLFTYTVYTIYLCNCDHQAYYPPHVSVKKLALHIMVAPPPPYDAPCPQWVASAMLVAETRHPAVRTARLGGLWSTKPRATERRCRVANPIKRRGPEWPPEKNTRGRSWLEESDGSDRING